jgi:cell wall-associated NlpC family hydrolase
LLADASGQGISIGINDSYRDYDSQVRVAREKGLYSQGGLAAEPGTSNHGWGVAVDLSFGVGALAWMRANAGRYGFFETVPREDWHWEYQGGGSSGNVPAGGGGGVAYPANPEGLEVASYPQVTPAIGKDSDPGVGPYLLVPRVASGGGVDPQRTGLGDDSAHTFVAEQLGIIRDEMYDEGWAVPGSDESADAFWTEAVNRLPVADPRSGRSCQAPTITGTASDQVAYRDQVAVAIGELWRCELDRAPRLDVMTSLDTQAGSAQVSQLVIDEAMSVAWAFSRWGTSACDATAEYAGVFPLTEEQFLANAAPEQLSAGRCSPAANIQAAAAAFVRLEQVAAEDRVEAGGPYSRMLGGWAAMPPALGSAEALAAFNSSGPGGGGGASVECRAALDTAVAVAERNEADAAAILSTVRADTVVSSTCAGVDQQVVDNALVESLLARVGVLKSVDELTEGGVGDPASGDADYAEQLARLDRDAAPVVVGRAELDARAGRLQSVADVLAASGVAMFTVGVDSAVPRLSSTGRSAADEPGHPVRTDPTSDDWAGTVVKLAGQLGGTWTGDERAQKKQSADDAMATIRQFWNVAGGTGPTGLYATGGIVGGNGSVSPDQCPTMAAPNTLRQGAEAVGLATICRNSVLQAPTPQAAAAIINALGPSMLGKPYSQPSRMQPTHFDCSSYVSRAYRAAGLMTGSWSPTTYTYLSGYPWTRRISPAETRPGDLVLNQPGHIVMALADGWMVHTNRTGDISHVKRLYDLNSVHAVVRIIPEAAPPTPAGTPL